MQKINKTKLSKDDKLFIISFMAYPLILFAVFYVYANFSSILLAFRQYNFDETYNWVLFDNFKDFIELISGFSDRWTIGFQNSLNLYILLSYILYKKCFMHRVLRVIVMVPQIISGFIMCLVFKNFVEGAVPEAMKILFGMQDFTNLLTDPDYTFGTTLFYTIWISFSTSLIVYPNAMNAIDSAIIESAKIDGINNMYQELWYITLPSMQHMILFSVVMQIQSSFTVSTITTELAGYPSVGYSVDTIVSHMTDVGSVRFEMGYASAIAVILFLLMAGTRIILGKFLKILGK